jgi:3-deoxy-manno-octulosonate cytidylyltransferase (CMP-KDO synthetase)
LPEKKVIGVIPARWGSTRFPGKSLAPICGKPLICHVIERARRAKCLSELLVATDDLRIAEAVEGTGTRAVMTRADHPSGTDRIAEAVRGTGSAVVINIQGDEPLIDPSLIDRLGRSMLADRRWDMGTAAAPITSSRDLANPSVVKVVWNVVHQALYFSRSTIPFVRDAGMPRAGILHWRHIGIYAYRTGFLRKLVKTPQCALERAEKLEQLRALHIGARILVLEADSAGIGVDRPEDVKYAEKELRRRGRHR